MRLEGHARSVADIRGQRAQLDADEASEKQAAMRRMKEKGVDLFSYAGVDFVIVPGQEKLLVRTSKAARTAMPDAKADTADRDDAGNPEPADLGENGGDLDDLNDLEGGVH